MFRKKKKDKIEEKVISKEVNKKKPKKPKKWNCENDGHKYEIIKKILYVDEIYKEIPVPTGQGQFFLECKECKKRKIFSGDCSIFNYLWESNEITTELFNKLKKEVREFLDEKQKEYKEALEESKKPKVKRKKVTKKKVKK